MKINQQLQKINEYSLAKIIFYKDQTDLENLDFYNIVFAANGIFIVLKNDFGMSFDKIENVKYVNSQLSSVPENQIISFIPKPPLQLFVKILEMFKFMNNKIKSELCVNVYYNKKKNDFHLDISDQFVNGSTADYTYTEKYEMSKDYTRYLQIHSHNSMSANFSSKDNNDENFTSLCYYGVVGKISKNSHFYDIESKFRIWTGIRFTEVNFGDIFDLGVKQVEMEDNIIRKLNSIIEFSKNKEKEKSITNLLPTKTHDFYPRGFSEDFDFSIQDIIRDCQL